MPKIWYTQTKNFSSFYYYRSESPNRELVKISLELYRHPKEYYEVSYAINGSYDNTGAYFFPFAHVGFLPYTFNYDESKKFRATIDGSILAPFKNVYIPPGIDVDRPTCIYMYKEPIIGYRVNHFMSTDSKPDFPPERGGIVIDASDAKLPPGITDEDLKKLAILCLKRQEHIKITDAIAPSLLLANTIKKLISP